MGHTIRDPSTESTASEAVTLAPIEIKSWTRLPRETDQQWAAFLLFRDSAYPEGVFGPYLSRSVARTAQEIGVGHQHLRTWSASLCWYARAGSYDREIDEAKVDKQKTSITRMRERHTRTLAKVHQLVELELDKQIARAEADPLTPTMSPADLRGLLDLSIKQDRLLHGQSTENVAVAAVNLEDASLEELELMHATLTGIQKRGHQDPE